MTQFSRNPDLFFELSWKWKQVKSWMRNKAIADEFIDLLIDLAQIISVDRISHYYHQPLVVNDLRVNRIHWDRHEEMLAFVKDGLDQSTCKIPENVDGFASQNKNVSVASEYAVYFTCEILVMECHWGLLTDNITT